MEYNEKEDKMEFNEKEMKALKDLIKALDDVVDLCNDECFNEFVCDVIGLSTNTLQTISMDIRQNM